jgi:hypothetical protein
MRHGRHKRGAMIGQVAIFLLGVLGSAAWAQLGALGGAPAPDQPAAAPDASASAADTPAPTDTDPHAAGAPADGTASPAGAVERDPFWPVGWVPPPEKASSLPADFAPKSPIRWQDAIRQLEVTALTELPGGGYVAIMKGIGVVERGDTIAVNLSGLTYRWKVESITSEGIVPERIGVTAQRER